MQFHCHKKKLCSVTHPSIIYLYKIRVIMTNKPALPFHSFNLFVSAKFIYNFRVNYL